MPTIGWFEILIIVAIAIIVLGPKDFPIMLKKVGSWIGTTKKYINNIQNEVSNIDIEDNSIQKKEFKEKDKKERKPRCIMKIKKVAL
jgi:sec-independent protein translocase protein TatB